MSNIEWTDTTWNPVIGCTPVSPGCLNCYAATMARRLEAMGRPEYAVRGLETARGKVVRIAEVRGGRAVFTGEVRCLPERLTEPLHWKRPRMVFVNSMSDLFHEAVPFEFIDRVFAVMALCPQHTFQVLTKRPERMAEYLGRGPMPIKDSRMMTDGEEIVFRWPLPNLWLGTSIESDDQHARARELLKCPAAVIFLSLEPLIGPVDLDRWELLCKAWSDKKTTIGMYIDWVIVGGESGPNARPCDVAWIRSIVSQCKQAGVACFVKQLGRRPIVPTDEPWAVLDRKGADPAEWPEYLRVREFPEVRR